MILPATTTTSISESDHSSYLSKRFSTGSTANSKFIVLGAMLGSIVGFLTVYYILLEIAMPLCKLCELKTDKSCEHTFINRQFDEVVEDTLSRPHSQMNTSNINPIAHSSSAGPNNSQQQEHEELTPVVPVAKNQSEYPDDLVPPYTKATTEEQYMGSFDTNGEFHPTKNPNTLTTPPPAHLRNTNDV